MQQLDPLDYTHAAPLTCERGARGAHGGIDFGRASFVHQADDVVVHRGAVLKSFVRGDEFAVDVV